jgi:hypothetical protein
MICVLIHRQSPLSDMLYSRSWQLNMIRKRNRILRVVGFISVAATLAAFQAAYWWYTVDDAYISYRYAQNLASGLGLVFNAGERVEGFTNFLWTVILAGAIRLGAEPVLTSKLLGVGCAMAVLVVTIALANTAEGGNGEAGIPAAFILASTPAFALWSVGGLETPLFALLFAASALRFLKEQADPSLRPWSALLMALCGMTRPEGVLVFAVSLAFIVGRSVLAKSFAARDRNWCLLFLAVGLPYFVWRLSSFGYPFPNTFYVKTGRGVNQLLAGVLYTTSAVKNHGGLAFLVLAIVPMLAGRAAREVRYLVALSAVWFAYNVYKGHDVLPLYRFMVPLLPIWFALSTIGLILVLKQAAERTGASQIVRPLIALFVVVSIGMNMVVYALSRSAHPELGEYQVRIRIQASYFLPMAERLRQIGAPGSSIALIDAGAIPYVTGWYTTDRYGLVDAHIGHVEARGPLGEKFDEVYVLSKKPTFIQTKVTADMERKGQINDGWAGDPELFSQPEFQRDYVRIDDRVLDGFFVRKDAQLQPHDPSSPGGPSAPASR